MEIKNADTNSYEECSNEDLVSFVVEQMKINQDKHSIIEKLVEMGVVEQEARQLVEEIEEQATVIVDKEELTVGSLLTAFLGGMVAAVLGGIIWGLIVITTNYEIGFVALGIGALSGYGVLYLARGKKGFALQILAAISSIFGIITGKYIAFHHFFTEMVALEYGEEVASTISIFSIDTITLFTEELSYIVSGFDLLWILLAVATAWKIPQGLGIKPR